MQQVAIVGVGMTPVAEHWDKSLRELAAEAVRAAMKDAGVSTVDALYLGNSYGATFSSQSHVGALVADYVGLTGVEAFAVDAGDASGGAALRTAYLAVASGAVRTALVVGVEKSVDTVGSARVEARNVSLDADYESIHGATLPALAGLLMRRYLHEHGVEVNDFEGFSINAHANGRRSRYAMYRNAIRPGAFAKAPMVAEPVNLFDSAPDGDGAAALVITRAERAADMTAQPVRIAGSALATDTFALQDRADMLFLQAAALSATRAYQQAGISAADVDLFELHDAFTILSALTLEATGFAERGQGWTLARDYEESIGLQGRLPICTFGGMKSRGNPAGAAGIYQAVEATLQLRGQADENQVKDARTALIQNLGGLATTAVTHILTI